MVTTSSPALFSSPLVADNGPFNGQHVSIKTVDDESNHGSVGGTCGRLQTHQVPYEPGKDEHQIFVPTSGNPT